MIDTTSLKFPSGDFSHTDLAKLNGKTNQQVWTRYVMARTSGQIIPATPPERKTAGKGKPTKMWTLNPNYVAPVVPVTPATTTPATPAAPTTAVVASATPAAPVVVPTEPVIEPAGDSVVLPSVDQQEAAADATAATVLPPVAVAVVDVVPAVEKVIEAAVAAIPATPVVEVAPVVAEIAPALPATAPVVVVAEVTPEPVIAAVEVAAVKNEQVIPEGMTELSEKCPICDHKLFSINDATGVMVWCAQPADICKSAENPAYHGKTAKEAAAGLIQRFSKLAESVA